MKKIVMILLALSLLMTGCKKAEKQQDETGAKDTQKVEKIEKEKEPQEQEPQEQEDGNSVISLSKEMTIKSGWTIVGDYETSITKHSAEDAEDRVLLATSASEEDGEIQWDDSQEWGLSVLTNDGAYNLFHERIQFGSAYFEVNETYSKGVPTEIITLYVFSDGGCHIYNYTYDEAEDAFVGEEAFATGKEGNMSKKHSTIPWPTAQ